MRPDASLARIALMHAAAVAVSASLLIFVLNDAPAGERHFGVARYWLPFALAIGAVLTLAVAATHPRDQRNAIFARSWAVYGAIPVTLLAAQALPAVFGQLLRGIHIALVGVIALQALAGLWRAWPALAERRRAILLGGVTLAVNVMLVPPLVAGMYPTADEPHYLLTAQSLVLDGDLDLRNDYAGDRYRAFYPGRLPDVHGIEVGTAIYPVRDLGLPVLVAPALALGGWYGVLVLLGAIAAVLAAQLYLLLRDLAFDARVAFAATAAAMLTHPLLTYSTQIYPDLVLALLAVSAARLLGRPSLRRRDLAACGALAGAMLLLSARAWPLAFALLALSVVAAARRAPPASRPIPRLAVAGLAFGAAVAPAAVVNAVLFGLPIPGAGYWLIREQHELLGPPHIGAIGLLLDRGFGLLPRSPIYLLALAGLGALWWRARTGRAPLVGAVAALGLAHIAFVSSLEYWHSHWSPPSRNLVAAAPLLVLGLAGGLETLRQSRPRLVWVSLSGLLLAWTALITLAYAIRPRLRYESPDLVAESRTTDLWRSVAQIAGLDVGSIFPLAVGADASTYALAAAWTVVGAAIVLLSLRARRDAAR